MNALAWLALFLANDVVSGSAWMIAGIATLALAAGGMVAARRLRRPGDRGAPVLRRTDDALSAPAVAEVLEPEVLEPPPGFKAPEFVLPPSRLPSVDLARTTPDMGAASPRLAGLIQRLSEPEVQDLWGGGYMEYLDVVYVLEQVLTELLPYAEERGVVLEPYGPEDAPEVCADWDALARGLFELILNAVDFANEGGTVRVRLADLGLRTAVVVEDDGPEIDDGELCEVFPHVEAPGRPWALDLRRGGRLEFSPNGGGGCVARVAIPSFVPEREPHLSWL